MEVTSKKGPRQYERASVDGLCHNILPGTSKECGRTAEWSGGVDMPDGTIFYSGICQRCKNSGWGDVVQHVKHWKPYTQLKKQN